MTILSLLLSSWSALAAEAVPISKGDPAPFAGQLLTTDLAIRLGQKADRCDSIIELEKLHQQELAMVQVNLARQKEALANEARIQERKVWETRLEHATSWYTHPLFVAAVTAVSVGLLVYAAKETIVDVR